MGVWDYISGANELVRRNWPDLTTGKSWCSSSFGYTTATVSSVKDNAGKFLGRYWPTEEARSKIGPFATSIAKYSAEEGLKFVPGGSTTYKIVKKSLRNVNKSEKINNDNRTVNVKGLAERLEALEREFREYKRSVDRQSATNAITKAAKEFIKKLSDLLVPGTSRNNKKV